MASRAKNKTESLKPQEISQMLEDLQKRMDRCKVMFEQYFLGIQKRAPLQLQIDLERKIRVLTQAQIRNTGMRFRFTTLSQKFASYNTYWKRTMRQIESGTYIRDMARVGRQAAKTGKEVPDEVLAKMPKRMRDKVLRDREAVSQQEKRKSAREEKLKASGKVLDSTPGNVHKLDVSAFDDDIDLDAIFSGITTPAPPADPPRVTPPPVKPRPKAVTKPAATPSSGAMGPPRGMTESDGRALFERYKKARELVGDQTSHLTYDKLMRGLNKQAPKIMAEHNAKGVRFDVVVKGARVILKAKPQK